uniref:Uncharacterized protein n=1 Tax=Anguilla anguilla TaxID=7936 RepID=A0A0E9VUZ0_ANGAN
MITVATIMSKTYNILYVKLLILYFCFSVTL